MKIIWTRFSEGDNGGFCEKDFILVRMDVTHGRKIGIFTVAYRGKYSRLSSIERIDNVPHGIQRTDSHRWDD